MTEPVDWSVLQDLADAMEDDSIVDEIVTVYLDELPRRRAAMESALDGDPEVLRDAAHALKASSQSVGALDLGELCRTVEASAREGDIAQASAVARDALVEIDRVQAALAQGSNR